jgi:hypothetical protein
MSPTGAARIAEIIDLWYNRFSNRRDKRASIFCQQLKKTTESLGQEIWATNSILQAF